MIANGTNGRFEMSQTNISRDNKCLDKLMDASRGQNTLPSANRRISLELGSFFAVSLSFPRLNAVSQLSGCFDLSFFSISRNVRWIRLEDLKVKQVSFCHGQLNDDNTRKNVTQLFC